MQTDRATWTQFIRVLGWFHSATMLTLQGDEALWPRAELRLMRAHRAFHAIGPRCLGRFVGLSWSELELTRAAIEYTKATVCEHEAMQRLRWREIADAHLRLVHFAAKVAVDVPEARRFVRDWTKARDRWRESGYEVKDLTDCLRIAWADMHTIPHAPDRQLRLVGAA